MPDPALPPMIGASPSFLAMQAHASALAPLDRPVLVVGERGTGKELVAARLHFLSPRWRGPFVTLNCAAIPETLIEAELFGHEAGAFTGAVRRRAGRFERAEGGTLFLDELHTAPPSVQEKLLRVLEYGTYERVGGLESLDAAVRVVAAANVDLPGLVEAGRFRADLLDRLAFDVVTVPPLRARREDIPLLAQHFAVAMALRLGLAVFPGWAPAAEAALAAHPWPGNVRELRNVVERAVHRHGAAQRPIGEITFDPFASPWRPAPQTRAGTALPGDLDAHLAGEEQRILEAALAASRGNQRRAAEVLGLTYHAFRNRMRKHGVGA